MDLRANTATDVLIGPFVDKTDGNTTEDALTLTAAEIKLSKNGQALTLKSNVTSAAFDDDGYYNCELNATDTNTEGNLVLIVHQSANALPVRHEYDVLSEAAWDSLYVAKDTGFMDVNIKAVSEDTTAADNLELACDNYSVTRGLTGTALPAAVANAAGGVPISAAGALALDTKLANTNEITAARMGALTDWINGGRLDNLLDAIPTTAMRGTDSAALASVCTEPRLAELDAGNLPTDIDAIPTAVENRQEMDSNSTGLAAIFSDTNSLDGTKIPDTISLAAINAEVDTALDTALPASPTTGSINDILDRQEELLVKGSAATGTLSTTEMTTDLTITVADQYNGRLLTFRKDTTTAALRGQQTDITATTVLNGKLGFTALTTAPANGDLFDIT